MLFSTVQSRSDVEVHQDALSDCRDTYEDRSKFLASDHPHRTFRGVIRDATAALRVQQWLKNLLIFVPALVSHTVFVPEILGRVCLGFLSFSICASAGYLINDLLDIKADREHPAKRDRPFASGRLSSQFGLLAAALLFLLSLALGDLISRRYVVFLCGYLTLAVAYSLVLKTMLLVDVFMLAFFYTFRLLLGGAAARVTVSFWLAAFATFFFFSLALMKRFIELRRSTAPAGKTTMRRDYRPEDTGMIAMWGAASGCASVVVLALYINAEEVVRLYHHPNYLWPVCLAVLFWLSRIWMLANRNEIPHDPIIFAATDQHSYVIGALAVVALVLSL